LHFLTALMSSLSVSNCRN